MSDKFELVKQYLFEMELPVIYQDPAEELVVVEDQSRGVSNLIIDCESPIVVLEQMIMKVPSDNCHVFKRLLQMNRTMVHGAFVLDEDGTTILFRDTLQMENLDRNELEGSIQALGLALAEYSAELLTFAHKG